MSVSQEDYYTLLGVSRDADGEEIKRAYRKRARETHPDVNCGTEAEEDFKRINEAYEVLSDPEKRARYDRYGTTDARTGGYGADFGSDFFGIDDLFSVFFGGMRGSTVSRPDVRGRDLRTQVSVTLEQAGTGVTKEITITRPATCEVCGGSGVAEGGGVRTCPRCRGTGQERVQRRTLLGIMESSAPCTTCGATGVVVDRPCPACGGQGRRERAETITIEIPAGVSDGLTLRVSGGGEAGVRGARAGDLLVTVRVLPHEFLHREGDDLHAMAQINIAQAALGGTIIVPGLEGDVEVSFGAGVHTGDVVRVKGKGMPTLSGGRGDFLVHLDVVAPKRLTKRQRELLKELGETMGTGSAGDKRTPLAKLRDWLNS